MHVCVGLKIFGVNCPLSYYYIQNCSWEIAVVNKQLKFNFIEIIIHFHSQILQNKTDPQPV